ncbi:MAG: hypothetical protein JW931_00655 [Methanomicrobiaceae archaeon]|nr:hypothetical protein [Methanomicrobiaceae archaeon]
MENNNIIVILLLVVIIAGGGYILLVKYPPLLAGDSGVQYVTSSAQPTSSDSGLSGENVYITGASSIDYVYAGETIGTTSDIKSLDIYAKPLDWDENLGNDGIAIHFTFYDAYGRKVIFSETSISTQITVYSPSIDIYGRTVSPRKIFYKGYTTITSSDEGSNTPYGGIRIPYSSIKISSDDYGIGQIKMSASLPTGGTMEAYENFLWPKT